MHGHLDERAVVEWIHYHRLYIGVDHFVFYNSGAITPSFSEFLQRTFGNDTITETDFREAAQWDVWYWAQGVAIHDCVYRSRDTANWVMLHDIDEYIEVMPHSLSFKDILAKHKDAPWLTHGCIVFSITHCGGDSASGTLPSPAKAFLINDMVYRWPDVYCMDKSRDPLTCVDQVGHRKYVVNPRKVQLMQIHVILKSEQGGVDLSVDRLRHVHFRGLADREHVLCTEGVPGQWWMEYHGAAEISRAVRECLLGNQTRAAEKDCTPGRLKIRTD